MDDAQYREIIKRKAAWKADLLQKALAGTGDWDAVLLAEESGTCLPKLVEEIQYEVTLDVLHHLLREFWDMCDFNLWDYRDEIVDMFRSVGYCAQGDAPQPEQPIRLFRGTTRPRWARGCHGPGIFGSQDSLPMVAG